jgi:hypothetical protein
MEVGKTCRAQRRKIGDSFAIPFFDHTPVCRPKNPIENLASKVY